MQKLAAQHATGPDAKIAALIDWIRAHQCPGVRIGGAEGRGAELAWSDLLQILREKVKPERDRMGGYSVAESRRENWWKYGTPASELRGAVSGLRRCLVISRVSKHLALAWQPIGKIFSESLYVFSFDCSSAFAALQSRVHEAWARLLSSTLEDWLRYAASDCFENFPFPEPDPRTMIPALEEIGEELYDARAAYMIETNQGLTQTYNELKDPDCNTSEVVRLRALHLELDRAVLAAYGWADLISSPGVPPCTTSSTDAERQACSAFEDAVIDRLFALNAERAAAERAIGADTRARSAKAGKPRKPAAKRKSAKASQPQLNLESPDD